MKGQIFVIREVLSFAIGIALSISIFFIFSSIVKPTFMDYAVGEYLIDVTTTVNSGIQQSFSILSEMGESGNSTSEISMPPKISGFSYMVYFSGNEVCSKTTEKPEKYCIESSVNEPGVNLTGIFHSNQKKIRINSWKDKNNIVINIS